MINLKEQDLIKFKLSMYFNYAAYKTLERQLTDKVYDFGKALPEEEKTKLEEMNRRYEAVRLFYIKNIYGAK